VKRITVVCASIECTSSNAGDVDRVSIDDAREHRPGWWNGIHGGLKIRCPRGHVGSNPTPGTEPRAFATSANPIGAALLLNEKGTKGRARSHQSSVYRAALFRPPGEQGSSVL
jgi:hypothetical protein